MNLKDMIAAELAAKENKNVPAAAVVATGIATSTTPSAPQKLAFGIKPAIIQAQPIAATSPESGMGAGSGEVVGAEVILPVLKPAGGGFKFGTAPAKPVADVSVESDGHSGSEPEDEARTLGALAIFDASGAPDDSIPAGIPDSDSYSIADIGSMDCTAITIRPESNAGALYRDHVPATLPDRDIPEDLSGEAKQFIGLLDGIYAIANDPEYFGNIVRSIMQELATHKEYAKLMCDEDVHTLMKGMIDSMGMASIKKSEAKAKRAPKSGANVKSGGASAMLAGLDMGDF